MFDFVRNNTRVLFFVLLLLIIPSFVFFGVQGYSQFREGADGVANVAGQTITQAELDAAHRNQVERVRAQMPDVDPKLFDSPQVRRQTLEMLVRERVLAHAADDLKLLTGDERLHRVFVNDPQFAFLRNPDGTVNKDLLSAQGMSVEMFEQRLRHDLSVQQVLRGPADSTFASKSVSDRALDAFLQQREARVVRFDAKDHAARVQPTDAQIEAYYKAHESQFQMPEQVKAEYLVLDIETIKQSITVPEEELRKYYEQNASRYAAPEERRASHILIQVDASAPADQRAQAKARAQELLDQLRKNPDAFADLARKHSQDPGSAANGGDLDFFRRGMMVKPFEDAAFSLKPGQISDVVETEHGFHIIRVTGARGGERRPFEAVRAEIEDEVRGQLAQQRYAEAAEQFSNTVYEQPDSLQPTADKLKLQVQVVEKLTRTPGPDADPAVAHPKVLEALFEPESLRGKRNIEAVEVAPNRLVSARVVEHTPARTLPLAEVRDRVRERVVAQQAAELARKEAEAKLAEWRQNPAQAPAGQVVKISRVQPAGQPREVVDAVLKAKDNALPAWIGVDLGTQGYAVVQVTKVLGRDESVPSAQLASQYVQALRNAEVEAYYELLKKRYKVEFTSKAPPAQ